MNTYGLFHMLHPRNRNTKILCLEFFICDKKHPTERRFLFPHELQTYQRRIFESVPKKARYINPLRRALRYEQILLADPNLNKSLLAKKLGTSRVRVTQLMGLLRIPIPMREKILKARVSERTLRRLSQMRSQDALQKEFNQIFSQNMSPLS